MKQHTTPKFAAAILLVQLFILPLATIGQDARVAEVNAAIRKEEMEHSHIMNTLHYLTDLYGPRLTGSPNHVNAAKWAAREMQDWGFDYTGLESWDFGHLGWVNERSVGLMQKPVQDTLTFEVLAWTPSTKGVVVSDAVNIVLPTRPTQQELTSYLDSVKSVVNGKIVLVGKAAVIPVTIDPPAKRLADDQAKQRFTPGATPSPRRTPAPTPEPKVGALTNAELNEELDRFLVENNVALRVNDAAMDHGMIRAFNNRTFDVTRVVPTVILRNEDYGRITRLLADKTVVRLEFDIRNRSVLDGVTSYNVIGEIAGTDKKDEVVMLGGHLDSWHAATGATDNAIGSSIMMEAARIIQALGLKPRRTVRVALWSGEEQGLLGSQAYVKDHFGSFEEPKPEFAKLDCYFNIDSGTGRVRGASVFGPPSAAAVIRNALEPFADFGVAGAVASTSRTLAGTDSTSFNNAGLAGVGMQQDPIEYQSHTWHTMLDTYERIVPEDARSAAVEIAAAVWQVANRDEMLARFTKEQMPAKPKPAAR